MVSRLPSQRQQSLFRAGLTQHRTEKLLDEEFTTVRKRNLINLLNRINFQDSCITLYFRHPKYNSIITLQAKPQPCLGEDLECLWTGIDQFDPRITSYEFLNFQITNGLSQILVEAHVLAVDNKKIKFKLPSTCFEVSARKVKRHQCTDIYVQISQNGIVFYGLLEGFSGVSQDINISMVPSTLLRKVNINAPIEIIIKNSENIIFAGSCTIIRLIDKRLSRSLVVKPLTDRIHRFKPKEYRSIRQILTPSPNLVFTHPIIGHIVYLKIIDISGSGIAVREMVDNSILVPGMIIHEAGIEFANSHIMNCDIQVLYSTRKEDSVRSGLVILDMDGQNHVSLMDLLSRVTNENSYISSHNIDLDRLWEFFFETGFVYPEKYAFIEPQKDKFRQVYKRLYTEPSEISRHVIYQEKGQIYGHVAMLRFYDKTWMIQHHAAYLSRRNRAGLVVAEQLGRYINEFHQLASANMRYLACYYRPQNRFPDRIFGGIARAIDNPQRSSIDAFGYFLYHKNAAHIKKFEDIYLEVTGQEDLDELLAFYEFHSGGLMLDALDLLPEQVSYEELSEKFERQGFLRKRKLFSLKRQSKLLAIIMVNISDVGLNMSDLTNCLQIFILDADTIDYQVLLAALAEASDYYEDDVVPVLMYPVSFGKAHDIDFKKIYHFQVLDLDFFDHYIRHLDKLLNLKTKQIAE